MKKTSEGEFYIITTNVYSPTDPSKPAEMVNFIITAKDPAGPWSEPHVIEGAPGIDPDLFFDDDGKVYYVGTHAIGMPEQNGIGEIWVQELDLVNWKLVGERYSVWRGACGGYTGAYLGLYASSNGQKTGQYADFDWVHYKGFHR